MKTGNNNKPDGGNHFLAGYGWQVLVAPALAGILLAIFFWGFGYDADLLWTNVLIVAVWSILVLFAFWRRPHGEIWRNYRWIIAPTVIILLFLFNVSWAQPTIATSSLEKSIFKSASSSAFQLHAEYPSQILFDTTEPSEISLWTTGLSGCAKVTISGNGLLFAVKPPSDAPLEWSKEPTLKFNGTTTAITLLAQPSQPPITNSQIVQLNLNSNSAPLATPDWELIIESKRDSQIRNWKKNFLATGGTIVSLITAIFVGIRQLEEEKKRQKAKQVEQAIANSDSDFKENFSGIIKKHLELTTDWNEWDPGLKEQFRKIYSSNFEEKLWKGLSDKTTVEMRDGVELCLQLCIRIFEDKKEKPIPVLKQLQSALKQDENAPLSLLSMLKEYPASIDVAEQIASAFPGDLNHKTIADYISRFPDQIRDLRYALGILDLESLPLKEQFAFYAKSHAYEDGLTGLTAWLKARELDYSPFADVDSPFYSVADKPILIDTVAPGFMLPPSNLQNTIFEFTNSWDAGAALFEYCKSLPIKIKDEMFFVAITPSLIEDHGMDQPRKLYLHALAEQWLWLLAETQTFFYSLKGARRNLAGRLLRWHDHSPSITVNKIARYSRFSEEAKNQTIFSSKIKEWLTAIDSDDLRMEEVNALIRLSPLPEQRTLFLISTIDLNPHVDSQISTSLHEKLGEQSDWLSVHDCQQTHFQIGNKSPLLVPQNSLVTQCNNRIRICSQNKVDAFNFLFTPHNEEPAENILAHKAAGSPGKMIRLGQKLLLQHVENHSPDEKDYEYLHIEDLIAIK